MYATALFLAGALAVPAEEQKNYDQKHAPHYVALGDVLGADVRMWPSDEAVREAAEDGDRAERPTGSIDELLVHPHTGELQWAVVSVGGLLGIGDKTVAVPMSHLRWNGAQECFDITATEEQLKALPEFDMDDAERTGLDRSIGVVEASWSRVADYVPDSEADADAIPERLVFDTLTVEVTPARFFAASDLDEYPLYARGEEFGDVAKGIVDVNAGRIAYALVSHGGFAGIGDELYVVPYQSLRMCNTVDGDEQKSIFCVDRSKEQLKSCVRYEKPQKGVLSEATARRADEMFDTKS